MTRIAIDPGHGGPDRGASFGGVDEADIVLHVAFYLEKLLVVRGFSPLLTRSLDVFISLGDRVREANRQGSDIFISLHCNADPDSDAPGDLEAKGEEIWVYDSQKSRVLGAALEVYVDKIFSGHRSRGVKTGTFYVLKRTVMPAALIELGFIDNRSEVAALAHPAAYAKIAGLIADGIERYIHTKEGRV